MFRYPMDVLHTERELDKKSLRSQHFHAIFAFLGTHVCFYYLLTVYLTPFDYLLNRAPFVAATARRRHATRRIAAVQPNDCRVLFWFCIWVCVTITFLFFPPDLLLIHYITLVWKYIVFHISIHPWVRSLSRYGR